MTETTRFRSMTITFDYDYALNRPQIWDETDVANMLHLYFRQWGIRNLHVLADERNLNK